MDNNIETIFNSLSADCQIENFFLNARPLNHKERNFAIFNCLEVKKVYEHARELQYSIKIEFFYDSLKLLQIDCDKIKTFIHCGSMKKISCDRPIREVIFSKVEFSQTTFQSQFCHHAELVFKLIM
ncbi:MAG: hypothetical protein IJW31_09570 [Lentisphaeria bacterium]|nr:hypothetical protein [Lentisphaeria bacterium]